MGRCLLPGAAPVAAICQGEQLVVSLILLGGLVAGQVLGRPLFEVLPETRCQSY